MVLQKYLLTINQHFEKKSVLGMSLFFNGLLKTKSWYKFKYARKKVL